MITDPSVRKIFEKIIDDIRNGVPVSPEMRNIVAGDLENLWLRPSNKKEQTQRQLASFAWLYGSLIDAKAREFERQGKTNPVTQATEAVAEIFGFSGETLLQKMKRGKRAAKELGMDVDVTRAIQRSNMKRLEED